MSEVNGVAGEEKTEKSLSVSSAKGWLKHKERNFKPENLYWAYNTYLTCLVKYGIIEEGSEQLFAYTSLQNAVKVFQKGIEEVKKAIDKETDEKALEEILGTKNKIQKINRIWRLFKEELQDAERMKEQISRVTTNIDERGEKQKELIQGGAWTKDTVKQLSHEALVLLTYPYLNTVLLKTVEERKGEVYNKYTILIKHAERYKLTADQERLRQLQSTLSELEDPITKKDTIAAARAMQKANLIFKKEEKALRAKTAQLSNLAKMYTNLGEKKKAIQSKKLELLRSDKIYNDKYLRLLGINKETQKQLRDGDPSSVLNALDNITRLRKQIRKLHKAIKAGNIPAKKAKKEIEQLTKEVTTALAVIQRMLNDAEHINALENVEKDTAVQEAKSNLWSSKKVAELSPEQRALLTNPNLRERLQNNVEVAIAKYDRETDVVATRAALSALKRSLTKDNAIAAAQRFKKILRLDENKKYFVQYREVKMPNLDTAYERYLAYLSEHKIISKEDQEQFKEFKSPTDILKDMAAELEQEINNFVAQDLNTSPPTEEGDNSNLKTKQKALNQKLKAFREHRHTVKELEEGLLKRRETRMSRMLRKVYKGKARKALEASLIQQGGQWTKGKVADLSNQELRILTNPYLLKVRDIHLQEKAAQEKQMKKQELEQKQKELYKEIEELEKDKKNLLPTKEELLNNIKKLEEMPEQHKEALEKNKKKLAYLETVEELVKLDTDKSPALPEISTKVSQHVLEILSERAAKKGKGSPASPTTQSAPNKEVKTVSVRKQRAKSVL